MVKKSKETVEDIMKQQLSLLENSDKILKLEKDATRDKKIIQELKEREKVSARTIVLFERKMRFLKDVIISDLLKICKENENKCEDIDLKLYAICNKLEELSAISEQDKAFILNKPVVTEQKEDLQSRFDRLKANFNQKIGASVLRKPGRPKKAEQSIVADIGLGKKVEKVVDNEVETQNKLNEIFYGTPTVQKKLISSIPQTADSTFDFAEALNPNHSLQDIMQDIMGSSSEKPVVYNKDNIDSYISRLSEKDINNLESGIMSKPHLKNEHEDLEEMVENTAKKSHRNGVFTRNQLFDNIKQ